MTEGRKSATNSCPAVATMFVTTANGANGESAPCHELALRMHVGLQADAAQSHTAMHTWLGGQGHGLAVNRRLVLALYEQHTQASLSPLCFADCELMMDLYQKGYEVRCCLGTTAG